LAAYLVSENGPALAVVPCASADVIATYQLVLSVHLDVLSCIRNGSCYVFSPARVDVLLLPVREFIMLIFGHSALLDWLGINARVLIVRYRQEGDDQDLIDTGNVELPCKMTVK